MLGRLNPRCVSMAGQMQGAAVWPACTSPAALLVQVTQLLEELGKLQTRTSETARSLELVRASEAALLEKGALYRQAIRVLVRCSAWPGHVSSAYVNLPLNGIRGLTSEVSPAMMLCWRRDPVPQVIRVLVQCIRNWRCARRALTPNCCSAHHHHDRVNSDALCTCKVYTRLLCHQAGSAWLCSHSRPLVCGQTGQCPRCKHLQTAAQVVSQDVLLTSWAVQTAKLQDSRQKAAYSKSLRAPTGHTAALLGASLQASTTFCSQLHAKLGHAQRSEPAEGVQTAKLQDSRQKEAWSKSLRAPTGHTAALLGASFKKGSPTRGHARSPEDELADARQEIARLR